MRPKEEKIHLSRADLDAIPDKYFATIMNALMEMTNETIDFSTPQVRPSVAGIYPLFIAMYAVLAVAGTLTNIAMITHIVRNKLHDDPTYTYIINIAVSDMVKCIFVLPITLAVLLVQNWIFGKFMCYFLPILQDLPIHVSMMTYLLIAGDRYRMISEPGHSRMPAFVCALGAWFFAVCIVLPHLIYTTYLDLAPYSRKQLFEGVGICVTNLVDDIQQYMRGLFLMTYVAPLTITAYIYVKASRELQTQEGPLAVAMYEARTKIPCSTNNSSASNVTGDGKRRSGGISTSAAAGHSRLSHTYDLYDAELDVCKEKRTQKYLIFMVSVFAILFCPLMILKLAKIAISETYENSGAFDITFTIFVWLGFISTVTTPIIYTSWQMTRTAKQRLRNYFRTADRRLTITPEDPVVMIDRRVSRRIAGATNFRRPRTIRHGNITGNNRLSTSSRGSASSNSPVLARTSSFTANLV